MSVNVAQIVPSVVIENNVLAYGGSGGFRSPGPPRPRAIRSGPSPSAGSSTTRFTAANAANGGVGIDVGVNASPTLLNNVLANLNIGIRVDPTSTSTVVGTTSYAGNVTNVVGTTTGTFVQTISPTDPLFVNAAKGNFYPQEYSPIIDRSLDVLQDRQNMITVRQSLGLPQSPILAPDLDLYGQLRADDPNVAPPLGMGNDVYKDRGAIDRVNTVGPTALVYVVNANNKNILDNDLTVDPLVSGSLPMDRDPTNNNMTIAMVDSRAITTFDLQLGDADTKVNNTTVSTRNVQLAKDGVLLVDGQDYRFVYNSTNYLITLIPSAGTWAANSTYTISLVADPQTGTPIEDIAGNAIQAGMSTFTIRLAAADFGESPMYTDTSYTASATTLPAGGYALIHPAARIQHNLGTIQTSGVTTQNLDGMTFKVTDSAGTTVTFEFDSNGSVISGNQAVTFTATDNAITIASEIASAINAAATTKGLLLSARPPTVRR